MRFCTDPFYTPRSYCAPFWDERLETVSGLGFSVNALSHYYLVIFRRFGRLPTCNTACSSHPVEWQVSLVMFS